MGVVRIELLQGHRRRLQRGNGVADASMNRRQSLGQRHARVAAPNHARLNQPRWDGAALHVPGGEPESLREALANLCADDQARHNLQRAAAKRAREYSIDRAQDAYLKLYRHVLAHASEGRKPAGARSEPAA